MTHLNFRTDTAFQSSLVERIINGQTQIHFIFYLSNHICFCWRVTGMAVTGMKKNMQAHTYFAFWEQTLLNVKYVLKRVSFGSKACTKELKLECAYFLGQTS